VLLQLVGPENAVVARRATYPGLGSYPTTSWLPGRSFCDLVRVEIPPDLERTLLYQVEIAVVDWETMTRLPVVAGDGRHPEAAFAAEVRLAALAPEPLFTATTSEPLELLSYQVQEVVWRPNGRYPFTLVWQVNQPLPSDYTLFVHLRSQVGGPPVAQSDGPPLDGWYPTSWWEMGEQVIDERQFALPPAVASGSYDLVVGWYLRETGERFGPEYLLALVEVR